MEKQRNIKLISIIVLVVGVLGVTIAFALLSKSLVVNSNGKVSPQVFDIHFKAISEARITGKAEVINAPTINSEKKAEINNLEVLLKEPQDKIEYTVYIENSSDMNAKIEEITYLTLTEEESKIFKFSAKYEKDGSPMQVGDLLYKGQIKKVIITIEYLDISDKNLLPKEAKTIDINFKIKYVQDNTKYEEENNISVLPDGYKECEYLESTGTQYIDTGYYPKIDTKVEMDLSFSGDFKTTGSTFISAVNKEVSNDVFTVNFRSSSAHKTTIFFWLKVTRAAGGAIRQRSYAQEIINGKNTLILDRKTGLVTYAGDNFQVDAATGDVNDTLKIFASHDNTPFQAYNMRLYSLKIYTGNSLDRNYIPALDNNDKPCMYDTVSGNTFYNKGTGEFNYQLK